MNWKILRSEDYGTPQERHRLIVVAVRCDVARPVGINSDADVARVFPETDTPAQHSSGGSC